MKIQFLFLILIPIMGCTEIRAQAEILEKTRRVDDWKLVGKCENNFILEYKKNSKRNSWVIVGKVEDSLIFEKLPGKNRWKLAGMFDDSMVYMKKTRNNKFVSVGKYSNEWIYRKGSRNGKWTLLGKHSGCPGGAAYLLLLGRSNASDASSFILVF